MPYATQMQVGGVMPVAGGVNITDAVAITTPFFASAPGYLTLERRQLLAGPDVCAELLGRGVSARQQATTP